MENTSWLRRCTFGGVRLYSAALLTLGAAFIHLAVAPGHLREYVPFGVYFLAVGCAQIVLAVEAAQRPTRRLMLIMATSGAALVGLWFVSRTVGLPIGPTPGQPEDIGLADVICDALEVIATLLWLSLVGFPARRLVRRVWLVGLGTAPTALLGLALTALAVSATLNDMPEAASAAPIVDGQSVTSVARLAEAPGQEPVKHFTLTAAPAEINGQQVWALNGSVPGPELRVNQGDRVQVTLINHLPESTTLHWHGVAVPNAEDGVAGVTQDAVAPGAEYTYEFVAREAGTYWYHSHQQTESQLPHGLFGALVVLPVDNSAREQRDISLILHGASGLVSINGATDNLHVDALPGETVRLRLINAVAPGMDGGPEAPVLVGAPFRVVALDGHDLSAPQLLEATRIPLGMGQRADVVFTMPASGLVQLIDSEERGAPSAIQRFFTGDNPPRLASVTIGGAPTAAISAATDVSSAPTDVSSAATDVSSAPTAGTSTSTDVTSASTDVTSASTDVTSASTDVTSASDSSDGSVKSDAVAGSGAGAGTDSLAGLDAATDSDSLGDFDASSAPLLDLARYGLPADDPVASATPDVTAPIILGEHPGMREGRPQLIHTINNQASPDVPPVTVATGQIVRLHIVNTTGEYHPMHLHGHVMSVLAIDGEPLQGSPLHLDSVLLGPHQTIDVAFAANNPGVWMFHCHVLLHAGMGMTTSINYVGYATPYEMGTRSGNMPE